MKIIDFSGLSVVRVSRIHSSTIRLYFDLDGASQSDVIRRCEITFDYCVWAFFRNGILEFDSDSESLPDDIQVIVGAQLDYVKWLIGFNSQDKRCGSPFLTLRFTNGMSFRLCDHEESTASEYQSPMLTFCDGTRMFQFMDDGTISARDGKWS